MDLILHNNDSSRLVFYGFFMANTRIKMGHILSICFLSLIISLNIEFGKSEKLLIQPNLNPSNFHPTTSCQPCQGTSKYCPTSVGCGYVDIQGWECYCSDWTWCRPTSDCSIPQVVSVDLLEGLPIGMNECNISDANQWVIAATQTCLRYSQVSMNAIDEYDNPFVLTATEYESPVIATSLDPTRETQSWLFSNYTLSPLSSPAFCLTWNSTSVIIAYCDEDWSLKPNTSNRWTPITSTGSPTLLSALGTSLCLSLYPPVT